ncbi:MAG TPA: SNF2-related protein [Candidatus Dormibacteraeota bacterium]|nr:SNF2-related protein [Candidatus Dormibacteraeota bacterium]
MPTPDRARLKSRPGSPAQPAQPAANGYDASWLRLLVRDGSGVRCSPEWLALLDSREELPDGLGAFAPLLDRLKEGELVSEAASQLVDGAVRVWSKPGFDAFISLPRLRFTPFAYQLRAAEAALGRMRGRAILADEVGLGKTIEAGLVLSELYLRRLVQRTLIIVPAGLVEQWWEELDRKFGLPALAQGSQAWNQSARPWDAPIVIASVATARRGALREELAKISWDLIVFDEAHRLKNARSASGRLARSLRARYLLLITATPVENRLDDLFQLVNLVRPGHLGTAADFRARHRSASAEHVREIRHLQARLRDVMVRHRRSEVALMLPRRLAETVRVAPGPDEAELYRLISRRVRESARTAAPSELLALRAIQRLAGSGPAAAIPTLERAGWGDLAERARRVGPTAKSVILLDRLKRHVRSGEKVVVFTAFLQTLDALARTVEGEGLAGAVYHGGLTRRDKEAAVRSFREAVPVLLTTEAAGEGRNLQFCHVMLNFDLPWNPMQIEQRLGRIHRIGQDHEVLLTNLATIGTIEDKILGVLERKINLFELVVGELDMILGRIEDDFDFESAVFQTHVESRDEVEFVERLEALGDELARARIAYRESRERTDRLVGEGIVHE